MAIFGVLLLILASVPCVLAGHFIGKDIYDSSRNRTYDAKKTVTILLLICLCLFGAGIFITISGTGDIFKKHFLGKPLADRNLEINEVYEIVADMGSATNTAVYPKRVLLKKDGDAEPSYFVLLNYLPEKSKQFVVRRYHGETDLLLLPCSTEPAEKK